MEKIKVIAGNGCPMLLDNIDTDKLISVSENSRIANTGFEDSLFAEWRYNDRIKRIPNKKFILNNPSYINSNILISGRNFGCGSSRESAVWALRDYGFKAILANSFNTTFYRNCIHNSVLPIELEMDVLSELCDLTLDKPGTNFTISLKELKIKINNKVFDFHFDSFNRELLLTGKTEIEVICEKLNLN